MQNKYPLVSIIIPVFRVEKFLRQCLDSVLKQTLSEIEVIIIDDGSPDSSPQICDEYAKKDSRIRVFHNKNHGYGYSCNFGISHAKGKYVAIVEPDDFIDSDMMSLLYNVAVISDVDIVKSSYWEYIDLPKVKRDKLRTMPIEDGAEFTIFEQPILLSAHPSIWSCLYKREFLQKNNLRFPESFRSWEDNLFQVITLCSAKKIKYTNSPRYHWRKNYMFDSDRILNPLIPLLRVIEIHTWLTENNIYSPDILACLRRKEMSNLNLSYQAAKFSNLKDLFSLTKKYVELKTHKISRSSKFYKSSIRFFWVKNSPMFFYLICQLKIKFKKFIRRIVSNG